MKKIKYIMVLWFLAVPATQAALALDRTRIIFPESSDLETVRVNNPSEQPYLSQVWLTNEKGEEVMNSFIVVPPVVRIDSKDYALLRIENIGANQELPNDRESLFYFHVREVPPRSKNSEKEPRVGTTGGSIQFAIESVIKMFYRPENLKNIKNIDMTIAKGTQIDHKNNITWITNNTPFYITYFSVRDKDNKKIEGVESFMLKPFSKKEIKIPYQSGYQITHINDYGALVTNWYQCNNQSCQFTEALPRNVKP